MDVIIGGVSITVIIDSGASSNIISESQWHMMKQKSVRYKRHNANKRLFPYGSSPPLKLVQSIITDIQADTNSVEATFFIVQGDGPILLGRSTSMDLQLLTLGHVREDAHMEISKTNFIVLLA